MLDPNIRGPTQGSKIPAGFTYFGQFIDHDITLEQKTTLVDTVPVDLNVLVNDETSFFDLSSVYGVTNNILGANGLFAIGKNSNGEDDLPRNASGVAIIGDPRNDENVIISQLQLAFLKFHNKVFADVSISNPTFTVTQLIALTRQIVTWHYQWLVVNDFLQTLCGKFYSRLFDANGVPIIHPAIQSMYPNLPIELAGAIYRFGHSMIRDSYYLNIQFDQFPIFSPSLPTPLISIPDLRGFRPLLANQTIDWSEFVPMPFTKGFQVTENNDTFMTEALFNLPMPTIVADNPNILPLRSLLRGAYQYQLPSGQDLAKSLGILPNEILSASAGNLVFQTLNVPLVSAADIFHLTTLFGEQTPLFYYTLKDNHVNGNGEHLGSLPSAVIGQTFLSLLLNDKTSYLNNGFVPTAGMYGCVSTGTYRFAEFFTYALGLQPFTPTDIIPDANTNTNFFDPFENRVGLLATVGHPLQIGLGIPGAAQDVVVGAYPGRTIGHYDPTLALPVNTTQSEINQVASNAIKFGVDTTLAVVRFINNRTILGIAQGLIAPLAPNAPVASIVPPATSQPIINPPTAVLTPDQLRALAIFTETDNAQFMLKPASILDASRAATEINNALFGIVSPPIVIV
jgi:hypothetical protein